MKNNKAMKKLIININDVKYNNKIKNLIHIMSEILKNKDLNNEQYMNRYLK